MKDRFSWKAAFGGFSVFAMLASSLIAQEIQQPILVGENSPALNESNSAKGDEGKDELGDLGALLDADLGQLARTEIAAPVFNEEVTTVARQESSVGRSPAAVYVITGEMIRRSGVRSIPEALRLAPGVQVAKIDANIWAISIRGFNQRFANQLLVQIDGRTVYTPLFAGVWWDVQDVLLEDVERIEVVRGPGATVWGANAVNGVINIITKRSNDSQGVYAEGGGGDQRGFASGRVGGKVGNATWRVYGKWFERAEGISRGTPASDDWRMSRFGFRTDWQPNCSDTVTFQGDYYDGTAGLFQQLPTFTPPFSASVSGDQALSGGNVLYRWSRELSEDANWSLQFYYDRTERFFTTTDFREARDTVDVDWQRQFRFRDRHSIVWGLGYRNSSDNLRNSPVAPQFFPTRRGINRYSAFAQDQITLKKDRLYLTTGSKFSWNDYTGFEIQPTGRLLFTPTNRQSIWASVSRAVRTPSRSSDDIRSLSVPQTFPVNPTFPTVLGNRNVESEELLAWEAGIRSAPSDGFYWDLALFYNQYDGINAVRLGTPGIDPATGFFSLPLTFVNGTDAETYGFEFVSTTEVNPNWTVRSGYSFLRLDVHFGPQTFQGTASPEGQSPRNQFFCQSSWDIGCDWEFDLVGRYADSLGDIGIPRYFELDSRIAWRPSPIYELALVGRNLLDAAHPEFNSDVFGGVESTEVPRELYGMLSLRY